MSLQEQIRELKLQLAAIQRFVMLDLPEVLRNDILAEAQHRSKNSR